MKRKLFKAVCSTAAAILLCEFVLWLVAGQIYPPVVYPGDVDPVRDSNFDPKLGWKLPPGSVQPESNDEYSVTYRANSQGFRAHRDFTLEAPGRKIAFVGDSYTFGSGVSDNATFAALLEETLPDTWSYNFGIGAYGIDQMWVVLRHAVLPIEPDHVVLSFIRNDLDRSLSAYRKDEMWRWKPTFRLHQGELVSLDLDTRPGPLTRFVHRHSRLHRLWRRTESSLSRRYAIGYRWRLNRALFEAIRDDCRAAGVPLLVVHIPINRRKPVPMFGREFADMGIEYLDLGPLLPVNADSLYYPRDRHFNAAGHRFAAEAIAARLQELGE